MNFKFIPYLSLILVMLVSQILWAEKQETNTGNIKVIQLRSAF